MAVAAGKDPLIVSAALEGLRSLALRTPGDRPLADSAAAAAINSLGQHDMAIVSTAAGMLGDSLFRRSASVEPVITDLDFGFLRSLQPVVRLKLVTSRRDILIELDREGAPFTTMSIVKLVKQRGFDRGLTFHSVVPNLVVQGGDPRGNGWGGQATL